MPLSLLTTLSLKPYLAQLHKELVLGVVIAPQVRPTEVRPLAKSLLQGFHKNFPNQDLKVLMYAPDKKLILTAEYDKQSQQVEYK